jgi:hypothetical protein
MHRHNDHWKSLVFQMRRVEYHRRFKILKSRQSDSDVVYKYCYF